ncbi:MAG: hypothetical protein RR842_03950 [Gordonibacter sp.]|uniref:hypothetical protein n=1 Tax=Gordonibacter sp. TaxID=1968902 RepID=UPI002FC94FB6
MDVLCNEHSAHEVRISGLEHRVTAHGEDLDLATETLAKLGQIEEQNREQLKRMDARITLLENDKGRKWDALVGYVMMAMVGAVIGFIASQIGLN